ncbi:MAG: HD domain-containing phosphohydrolase [Planctomycetota bacterium]
MPRLRIVKGPHPGQTFPLEEKNVTLGRDPSSDVPLFDGEAKPRHAEIYRVGELYFIRDLHSRSGTLVNDIRVEEEFLREGDRIRIADTVLVFEGAFSSDREGAIEFSSESEEAGGETLALQLEDLFAFHVSGGEADEAESLRLRSLYRLSRLLSEERDLSVLVDRTLEFVTRRIGAEAGYLFLLDPGTRDIVPLGIYQKTEEKHAPISRRIIRRALQEGRAVLAANALPEARPSPALPSGRGPREAQSVICAPLSARAEAGGVLYVTASGREPSFHKGDLELLAAMAEMTGLALENLRREREGRERFLCAARTLVRLGELGRPALRGSRERLAACVAGIAAEMGLHEAERGEVELAALLHDLGPFAAAETASLNPPGAASGPASPPKRLQETLKTLDEMACPRAIHEAVRCRHERYDGSGPEGLRGRDIPLFARILAVASAFDERANGASEAARREAARAALLAVGKESGRAFDSEVVKALILAHEKGRLYRDTEAAPGAADPGDATLDQGKS